MEVSVIKIDLLNKLNNDLYLAELEFERLSKAENINYSIQLSKIETILEDIIMIKTKISAVNNYFKINERDIN